MKLIFASTHPDAQYDAERMWVEVATIGGHRFTGRLANDPDDIPGLSYDEMISFESSHIVAITFQDEKTSEAHDYPVREYWDRCLVDDCVLQGESKVALIYREDPLPMQEGHRYPDSGWRIRGDQRGLSDAELEARDEVACFVALGAVLNRDDSWVHLIDDPIGARYNRDWTTNKFIADADRHQTVKAPLKLIVWGFDAFTSGRLLRLRVLSLMRLGPTRAFAAIDNQRRCELNHWLAGILHNASNRVDQRIGLAFGRFEDQFVMHLQQHPRG